MSTTRSTREIFVLEGSLCFDRWYRLDAPAYCNHPPYWVHPTNFWAEGDLVISLRESLAPVVQLCPIPDGYAGEDFLAPGAPTRAANGVNHLQVDDVPWRPIVTQDGVRTGVQGKRIWEDVDDGWVTWWMRVPAGWTGLGLDRCWPSGDEIFVVNGDLRIMYRGAPAILTRYGFVADTSAAQSSDSWGSSGGCKFIRWTRCGMDTPDDSKKLLRDNIM